MIYLLSSVVQMNNGGSGGDDGDGSDDGPRPPRVYFFQPSFTMSSNLQNPNLFACHSLWATVFLYHAVLNSHFLALFERLP